MVNYENRNKMREMTEENFHDCVDALMVMVLTPKINEFLKANDPKGLEQAVKALRAAHKPMMNEIFRSLECPQ